MADADKVAQLEAQVAQLQAQADAQANLRWNHPGYMPYEALCALAQAARRQSIHLERAEEQKEQDKDRTKVQELTVKHEEIQQELKYLWNLY